MSLQAIDPIAWVRNSKARFFPDGKFDITILLAYVVADVLELGRGECRIIRGDGWWFVLSDVDWLVHDKFSVRELFHRVVPAPAHGEHSLRAEVLLTAYANDVFTFSCGEESVITGDPPDRSLLARIAAGDWSRRVVAFRIR